MKRLRILIVLVLVVVLGSLALACFRPREPRYQGRTLTQWLDQAVDADDSAAGEPSGEPRWQAASIAVQAIGTNAIPFLSEWILAKDSKPKAALISWLNSQTFYEVHFRPDEERRHAASWGFRLLGAKAKAAWPVFVQWTQAPEPERRRTGLSLLITYDADKSTILPVYLRLSKDPDNQVRKQTRDLFHFYYPKDAEAAGAYDELTTSRPALANKSETNQPPAK